MIRDYFLLVSRNITRRKLRSWLTMTGIFIGIAAVVALIGLGEGLRQAINAQFGFLGTDILSVTASGGFGPPGTGVTNPLTDKELEAIKDVPEVEGAAGRIIEPTKALFNKKIRFVFAGSMPYGEDRKLVEKAINLKAEKGRLLKDEDKGAVVLGYSFLDKDMFEKPVLPGTKIMVQDKEFKVIGIIKKKGQMQFDSAVLMNEDDIQALFNLAEDEYDLIAVKVTEKADINKIKLDIEKELRKIRDVDEGEEDFSVETPASIIKSVNSVILGIQIFVYIIAGISLLVGGIGIMNTMYTAVVERTKEIGIMKSIGAKNSTIFTFFFIESGFLGIVGGIIGVLLGLLAATGLVAIGRLVLGSELISAHFTPGLIIGALLFSFVLGSFFGTLPAIRASQLNPVDALGYAK